MLKRLARPLSGLWRGIAKAVNGTYGALGGPGKLLQDFLNGTWLGHALHPVIVDVVVGGSTAAVLLLVLTWFGVDGLYVPIAWILGLVVVAALGSIVTGLTDFKDTYGGDQNVAGLHGLTNIIGTIGLVIAFIGAVSEATVLLNVFLLGSYGVLSIGAYIGGHIVFKYGWMVDHNAFTRLKRAKEFTSVAPLAQVPDDTPVKVTIGSTRLVLVRRGEVVHALNEVCSHAGGPLSEGRLEGDAIVCPWHGSVFRLADGSVKHGPSTTGQAAYRARVSGEQVEVQGPIE